MSGVIYKIVTGDDVYVGSTRDFDKRFCNHKSCIYNGNKNSTSKLYETIRANGGEWDMTIYKDNLSMNDKELCIYEEEVILLLGATLNTQRAYVTEEEKRQRARNIEQVYRNKNKEGIRKRQAEIYKKIVTCECGINLTQNCIYRHRKSAKHIRLMTSQA